MSGEVDALAELLGEHRDDMETGDYGEVLWSGCTCGDEHPYDEHDYHLASVILATLPKVSERLTDWGVRDDATGNVGVVLAYNRVATEEWLAELAEPSTLMRRERTAYRDDVTEWVPVEQSSPPGQATS